MKPNKPAPIERQCSSCGAPAGHPCAPFSRMQAPPPMKGFHRERRYNCSQQCCKGCHEWCPMVFCSCTCHKPEPDTEEVPVEAK